MKTEFGFIKELKKKAGVKSPCARLGIGDDCAVLPKDDKTDLVVTADLLVEDVDFRLEWSAPEFIGHKSLVVSLSDVAAMGAKPVWAMTSIGVPEKIWRTDFVERFYDGYLHLAKKFGVALIGGDISKTPDKIVVDSVVAGEVTKNKAVLRSSAKAGDLIFVTGRLGGSAGGLKLLRDGLRYNEAGMKDWEKNLLLKQLQPSPPEGRALTEIAASMIDLSDGLSSDLSHICTASGVGASIRAEYIPRSRHLKLIIKSFEKQLDFALNGGEDYELLFTVRPKNIFPNIFAHFIHIGEITANAGMIELRRGDETEILEPKGYRHF